MTINVGTTFDNSRNDYFRAKMEAKGLGTHQASKFAMLYHEPTKTNWTDEEFQAQSAFFVINRAQGVEAEYLEAFLNLQHESMRRAVENERNHSQFNYILEDFNPFSSRSVNNQANRHDPNQMFQILAESLAAQKASAHAKHENLNGRFSSEEELEQRLYVLFTHFNDAVETLASMFAVRASFNALFINGDASTIDRAFHDATKIGHYIRDHIWSGGSTDDLQALFAQRGFSESLRFLNNICVEHRNFNKLTSDGRRTSPLLDITENRIFHIVSAETIVKMQRGQFWGPIDPVRWSDTGNNIIHSTTATTTTLQLLDALLDGFGDTNQNIELI